MTEKTIDDESIPFYPDHVKTEFYVTLGVLAVVFIVGLVGLFLPVGLGDPADPLDTPVHIKPEWYFLALYQLLKYIPKTTGAVAPVIAVLVLIVWPFLDRKPDKSPKIYRARLIGVVIVTIVLVALTIWGEVS
jgi:quinol-cytochrome oxidoreductase complex cytochrome b subunit